MIEDRPTLIDTLIRNDNLCVGYYLSFNYSTLDGVPQHFAVLIERIAVNDDEVLVDTVDPDNGSTLQRRFSGDHTSLENPNGLVGVWFRVMHDDYGPDGLWVSTSPERQTMNLVTQ